MSIHRKYDVKTGIETVNDNVIAIVPGEDIPNSDTIDDPAVITDDETGFVGQSSPRLIQWMFDEINKLRTR